MSSHFRQSNGVTLSSTVVNSYKTQSALHRREGEAAISHWLSLLLSPTEKCHRGRPPAKGGVVGFIRGRQLHANSHGYELECPAVLARGDRGVAPLGVICPDHVQAFNPSLPPAASSSNCLKSNLHLLS